MLFVAFKTHSIVLFAFIWQKGDAFSIKMSNEEVIQNNGFDKMPWELAKGNATKQGNYNTHAAFLFYYCGCLKCLRCYKTIIEHGLCLSSLTSKNAFPIYIISWKFSFRMRWQWSMKIYPYFSCFFTLFPFLLLCSYFFLRFAIHQSVD